MEAPQSPPDGDWGWLALGAYFVFHVLQLILSHLRKALRGRDIESLEQRVDRLERQQDAR